MKERDQKLQQLIDWANANPEIKVMLLTSSLVNPYAPVDDFSDLDIELVFEDRYPYQQQATWLSLFGKPIAMVEEDETVFDGQYAMKMVLYEDGVKVDFKLYHKAAFLNAVNSDDLPEDWDVGYRVLVDKEELTTQLKAPTYQSVWIKKPSAETFKQLINDFWWDMTYVAKCLAREEIFYAKFMSEDMMRTNYLVPLIEWYIASMHNWQITTNKHGRLFKKYLPALMWQKIEGTFSGPLLNENWDALFAYADILQQLGTELAQQLGYPYPTELEKNIRKYLITQRSKS